MIASPMTAKGAFSLALHWEGAGADSIRPAAIRALPRIPAKSSPMLIVMPGFFNIRSFSGPSAGRARAAGRCFAGRCWFFLGLRFGSLALGLDCKSRRHGCDLS